MNQKVESQVLILLTTEMGNFIIYNLILFSIFYGVKYHYLLNLFSYMYHTLIDDDAHLRPGSVQHMGGNYLYYLLFRLSVYLWF